MSFAMGALHQKITLSLEGYSMGKHVASQDINKEALEYLKQSDNAMRFWRNFVKDKALSMNAAKVGVYFKEFVEDYNS